MNEFLRGYRTKMDSNKKTGLIILSVTLMFYSCSSVVRLAKSDEKAAIQLAPPTQAVFFVAKENVVANVNLEKHTREADRLYDKYGPATEIFLIGRTNAQTFIFNNKEKKWHVDVNKLKNQSAMILFDGKHKPFITYNVNKYEKTILKRIVN
ncbi:MAG: hypothetical protein FWF52_09045 [Candidatus Azobacteroides sp.]|nr:hypothetical protein [Candidatus Azobacteroides sp.]